MSAPPKLSARLQAAVDALPLRPGMRVVEVGGAPGAAAREVARRVGPDGHVLVIDRSATGIAAIERLAAQEIAEGLISVELSAIENLRPRPHEPPYDLAFACRVGVFDGRHPEHEARALANLQALLTESGRIFIDPS
jgi:cyclopropane fatty-acyl-phospholipid synthase-like methyltransferase